MTKPILLILIFIFLAAACSSNKMPSQAQSRPHASLNEVSGNYIHSDTKSNLRYGESLKAYSLGRRVDANDPSLLHEAGLVYRIESDSSWNLQPQMPKNIPYAGSSITATKDNENFLSAEIEVKANEQRKLYRYLKEASDKASGQVDALKSSSQISRKLLEQNKQLKKELLQNQAQKNQLNADLTRLKKQMQAVLKFYQEKQLEDKKSKFRRTP